MIHYPIPPHLQQAYADLGMRPGDFPVAEKMADQVISLPIGPHVSKTDSLFIANSILMAPQTC